LAVLRGWGRTALAATAIAGLAVARPLLPPHLGLSWWLPGYGDWSAENIAEGAPSTLALAYWVVLATLTAAPTAVAWQIR
jgi:hypothetical protein